MWQVMDHTLSSEVLCPETPRCVCACVRVNECACVHVYAMNTSAHIHMCVYTSKYECMGMCVCMCTCVNASACAHVQSK